MKIFDGMVGPQTRLRRRTSVAVEEQMTDDRQSEDNSNAHSTRKSQHQVTWGDTVVANDSACKYRYGMNYRRPTGPILDGGISRLARSADVNDTPEANRSESFVRCPSIRDICSDENIRGKDANYGNEDSDGERDDGSNDEASVDGLNDTASLQNVAVKRHRQQPLSPLPLPSPPPPPPPPTLPPSLQDASEQTTGVESQEMHVQTDDSDFASSEPEREPDNKVDQKRSVASDTSLFESVREWVGENASAKRPTTRSTSSQTVLTKFNKWWGGMNGRWCRDTDNMNEKSELRGEKHTVGHRCSARGDGRRSSELRSSKGNTVEDRRWKRLPTLSDKMSLSDEDSSIDAQPVRRQQHEAPRKLSMGSLAQSETVEPRYWQQTECEPRGRQSNQRVQFPRRRSTSAQRSVETSEQPEHDNYERAQRSTCARRRRRRRSSKPIVKVTRMNWHPEECEPLDTRRSVSRRKTDNSCEAPVRHVPSESSVLSDEVAPRRNVQESYRNGCRASCCAPRLRRSRASETPRWAQCNYERPPGVDFLDDEAEWRRRHCYQPPPRLTPSGECKEMYTPESARYYPDTYEQPPRTRQRKKGSGAYDGSSMSSLGRSEEGGTGAPFRRRLVYNIGIFMATFAFWVQMTTILPILKTIPDTRGAIRHTQTAIEGLQLCATLVLGRLYDVCGSRVVLNTGLVLAAFSHVTMALANKDVLFCVARLLTVGVPYLLDAQLTLLDLSPPNDVTGPIAIATLSYGLGMHMGTAIMPEARNFLGQRRDLLLMISVTPIVSLLLIELFGDTYYTTRPSSTDKLRQVMNLTRMLTPLAQSSRVCILLAVQTLFSAALFMFQGIVPLVAVSQLDLHQREISNLIRVVSITSMLTPCFGVFAVQPGKSYLKALQLANATLILLFMFAAGAGDLMRFYAIFVPLSMSSAMVDFLLTGALLVVAPPGQVGSVLGLNMAVITLAKIYGPALGSVLMSLHGFTGICVVGTVTSIVNGLLLVVFTEFT